MQRIPPLGFLGNAQQTPAAQLTVSGLAAARAAGRRGGRRSAARRRRRIGRKKGGANRTRFRTSKRRARLVKGSRAAKAYMAKLRRMRKRR